MGYTHSWQRVRKLPARKFAAAAKECQTACADLVVSGRCRLAYESDSLSSPIFNDNEIRFNGKGEEGHETFSVDSIWQVRPWDPDDEKDRRPGDFCKTARKPYDIAVCVCLIILERHFGKKFSVASDGDDEEESWPAAREWCQRLFGYGADFTVKQPPPRLTIRGLKYEQSIPSATDDHFRLANGWRISRRRKRWGSTGIYGAPEHRVDAKLAIWKYDCGYKCVATAKSLCEARWKATCLYVGELLKDAGIVGVDGFVAKAAERVGDWLTLRVLVWDYAGEQNEMAADAVKALFPNTLPVSV